MIALDLLRQGTDRLTKSQVPNGQTDARRLLAHVLQCGAGGLTPVLRDAVTDAQSAAYLAVIERRAAREPLSQITQTQDFMGHRFHVTKHTLSPRPDTETLVESAFDSGPAKRILDLGTGTGCIAISILLHWPACVGVAVDRSAKALETAKLNAQSHGVLDRLELRNDDWFNGLSGRFDMILSNPPYIGEQERASLEPEVRAYEPDLALFAGEDGFAAYDIIVPQARDFLNPGGSLHLECASPQAERLKQMLDQNGYHNSEVLNDLSGQARVVRGVLPDERGDQI